MATRAVLVAVLAALPACSRGAPPQTAARPVAAPVDLTPCTIADLARPARCGVARVVENRALGRGRTIPLRVVVVPPTEAGPPDPIVFISGGPGEAATESVAGLAKVLGQAGRNRAIVFVDQRGMGKDSPLRCKLVEGHDFRTLAGGEMPEAALRACLSSMDADPSQYTTAAAADDLDEILGSLGYGAVNVLGLSYGTFASQTLARAHPARVRTLMLDGVVLPSVDYVLRFASASQTVFDRLIEECAALPDCRAKHPAPRAELAAAMARLDAHPETLTVDHEGKHMTATLDRAALGQTVRDGLYAAELRGEVLGLIHDAAEGRYGGLSEAVMDFPLTVTEEMSIGAYLSIVCSEAMSGLTEPEAERATRGTFLGTSRVGPLLRACAYWPKAAVPAWLHAPLRSDVPALLLGGTMDPATPAEDLATVAATLPNAQTVIVPGEGHGVLGSGDCFEGLVARFLDHPRDKVDASCVRPVHTVFDPKPAAK